MSGPLELPNPFKPEVHHLPASTTLYRVFQAKRDAETGATRTVLDFNPGFGKPTRFAFFDDEHGKPVPVLYAAAVPEAAVAESLLHDIPQNGGALLKSDYQGRVLGALETQRRLQLAKFMGLGLRKLGVHQRDLTHSTSDNYPETVKWAKAAHRTGLDGAIWMSNHYNTDEAVVLFGDRVRPGDLAQYTGYARAFDAPADVDWLHRLCAPLGIQVRR